MSLCRREIARIAFRYQSIPLLYTICRPDAQKRKQNEKKAVQFAGKTPTRDTVIDHELGLGLLSLPEPPPLQLSTEI